MRCVVSALVLVLGLLAVGGAGGCSSVQTREFGVEVHNNSNKPLTLGLVKAGLPYEPLWESPGEHAASDPKMTEPTWGMVLRPGKTATLQKVKGDFAPGAVAYLRVYTGELSLDQILAMSAQSRNRADLVLRQGKTTVSIVDRGPFVDVIRTGYEPWGEAAKEAKASLSLQETP